ncbi:CLUMA_CG008971, isoform A [Clunio marinus]|uniref:CLUMA_CG008971, isoform A n=1 Tax=Clunio marinus TaxID=568069 RepID=A0A1J1I960_9DIPT|nr:CLUMA_CG008971, isoform A [Clunio marinus]
MDQTAFQAVSKLELKLEQNRKQKKKLKHELGAGRPCLICKEKCVGGLNLHFWRKICINCKCRKENHDLRPEDYDEQLEVFEILGVKIPDHKNLFKYSTKNQKIPTTQQVDWVPPVLSTNDDNASKRVEKVTQQYFEDLGEEAIPFKDSEAAIKRKELASMQIPPHDFAPEKCDNLSEFEAQQLKKYVDNVKKNYFGQGQVDIAEPKAVSKNPFKAQGNFVPPYRAGHDLNAINNNLANNMQNLTIDDTQLITLPCRACVEPITSAYVKAERLGKDAQWHPKCFKCKKCSQLLVDLIYFHFDNEIYCGRDLAELMKIPRCAACDELILVPEYTFADERNYHIKHFCCFHCDVQLAGQQYVSDDTPNNNPVCLKCYDHYYANVCSCCTKIIAPTEQGVSLKDIHFHMNCFNCGYCQKKLIGGRFCLRDRIPFCSAACVNSANM